jgi:hypothetical protein
MYWRSLTSVNTLKDYINARARYDIVKCFLECGSEIDIYGKGNWSELTGDYTNASYMGEAPIEEVVNLLTHHSVQSILL